MLIIKTIVLLLALVSVGNAIADDDDSDEIVRCKHCRQSTDICQFKRNCYRYTGGQQDSLLYVHGSDLSDLHKADPYDDLQIRLPSANSFRFIDIGASGEVVSLWPFNKKMFSTGQMRHLNYIIDFIRVKVEKDFAMDAADLLENPDSGQGDIEEHAVGDTGRDYEADNYAPMDYVMPMHFWPLGSSIPTVVEVETPVDINLPIPVSEIPVQELTLQEPGSEINPLFIHFGHDMVILEHGVPSQMAASLLGQLDLPVGTEPEEAYDMVLNSLSGIGGEFETMGGGQSDGHHNMIPGTYLLLLKDNESLEWYTAIAIMAQQHCLLFLVDEFGALETMVSTDIIFKSSLEKLIRKSQERLYSVTGITYLNVYFYPVKLSLPLVNAQMIEAAVTKYLELMLNNESDEEVQGPPPLISLADQVDQMESVVVSSNVHRIPVIVENVKLYQPGIPVSHVKAVYTDLAETCQQQTGITVNFIAGISTDTLAGALNAALENGLIDLQLLQGMLASFSINLVQLPESPDLQLSEGSFLLVIQSESQQEPPALLFVTNAFHNLTVWFVDLTTGLAGWKKFTTTTEKFRVFMSSLELLPVYIYRLES